MGNENKGIVKTGGLKAFLNQSGVGGGASSCMGFGAVGKPKLCMKNTFGGPWRRKRQTQKAEETRKGGKGPGKSGYSSRRE